MVSPGRYGQCMDMHVRRDDVFIHNPIMAAVDTVPAPDLESEVKVLCAGQPRMMELMAA